MRESFRSRYLLQTFSTVGPNFSFWYIYINALDDSPNTLMRLCSIHFASLNLSLLPFPSLCLSLNFVGRRNIVHDIMTTCLHFNLSSPVLWIMLKTVHSMFFYRLFYWLPCLVLFTVPWDIVLKRLDERQTCSYHLNFLLLTLRLGIRLRISSLIRWAL